MKKLRKKYYVHSKELKVVLLAESPMFACLDAFQNFASGHEIDEHYFYVDFQGFVGPKAAYHINTEDVILQCSGELDDGEAETC